MNKTPIISIDLGTTNSYIGVFLNDKVEIIPSDLGNKYTPSYVAFTDKEILVGEEAKNQMGRNSINTIFGIKKLIGRKYDEIDIKENMKYWPFKVIKDENSEKPQIQVKDKKKDKKFFPENIISIILEKLKKNASVFLGKEVKVKDAIITIPNFFNYEQREEIKEAANNSGLNIVRFLNSSTAIGLAYAFETKLKDEKNILVFDLGGGSLNISILSIEDGCIEERSKGGKLYFGGDDFTKKLFDYCVKEFKRIKGKDIRSNSRAMSRLINKCEEAKKYLSSSIEVQIECEYILDDENLKIKITRDIFEDLCMDLFKNTITTIENVIKDAKMSVNQINEIILVGGSSRIPKIQQMIQEFFFGKELNKSLNQDEAIVYGATIYSTIISNNKGQIIEKMSLFNVTPFSYGIKTVDGEINVIIPRNSIIPIKRTKIFSTYTDNQTSVCIPILEEENLLSNNNTILDIIFFYIPPMQKNQPEIEITFYLDVNFSLFIKVKSNGKEKNLIFQKIQ